MDIKKDSPLSPERTIKKLSEFGEGFKHHHENYEAADISRIRETGGTWRLGPYTFRFAEHFGFCYGVDKAIDMVFETCERYGGRRIFLTDQLIHNPTINARLKERGVQYLKRDAASLLVCDGLEEGDVVVVSAFGTDFRDLQNLRSRRVTIVDSTCGAIINVWKRVEGYARKGFITVMHGKRNHEETRATLSQAIKEGGAYVTIENKKEARELADVIAGRLPAGEFVARRPDAVPAGFTLDVSDCKMGMANQTTMLKGESLEIQEILRQAFEARFGAAHTAERFRCFDTICGATQDRQDALRKMLADPPDLVLIVGGFNSSNTTHLAEIAHGRLPIFHIESAADVLSPERIRHRHPLTGAVETAEGWLPESARLIGVTSGASTPDAVLHEILRKIASFAE